MDRPRDSQRQRVYNAEREWKAACGRGLELPEVEDLQEYTDRLIASRWRAKNFRSIDIVINDGRARRRGGARYNVWDGRWFVGMPRWTRDEAYLLHELAHCLEAADYSDRRVGAWHGWHYCNIMLRLVQKQMGPEAAEVLETEYRKLKVEF